MIAAIISGSLNSSRSKARDAFRTESIHSVQLALELYFNDKGYYPSDTDKPFPTSILTTELAPTYIKKIPSDPLAVGTANYKYNNLGVNTFYTIYIPYETKTKCFVCAGSPAECKTADTIPYWGVHLCK
jgi:type II secretory pathway pseudopilin PulG